MLQFILKGGPIMFPIIIGSIFGFAIALERFLLFRKTSKANSFKFVEEVFRYLKASKRKEALDLCQKYPRFPLAAIYKIGIERASLPIERLEKILEQAGNNQIHKLEKRLGALVSIVGIEPLLGFLGTITGLIRAFMSWEAAGANVTVNALAGGIYEAMITTAAGLMVAIPLYLCYNYFISRIKVIANELTNHTIQFLELITEINEGNYK
jgi:biopolymer transport protein ExbB